MFQFSGFPPPYYLIHMAVHDIVMRVSPFGNPRINGYLLLPEAYRSLSRPSSAPGAKAFPLRSFLLDLLCESRSLLVPSIFSDFNPN